MLDAKALPKKLCRGFTGDQFEQLFGEPADLATEMALAQGLRFIVEHGRYIPSTCIQPIEEAVFCIVDIETNGSKPDKHQIIELGAVKVQNRTIIDRFESLVHCTKISPHITEITGIDTAATQKAPPIESVLQSFKHFLGDAVFVGHDVKFDFGFTSKMMENIGMAPLLNRTLCTIDLAERTISAYRYGLSFLNEHLKLYEEANHHRALSDAMTTTKLFKKTLHHLPSDVATVEDLIEFSKKATRLKRQKLPPRTEE